MPGVLLSVIALPVLAPIAALIQLLFPGLLKDQWRQYRVAMSVFLSQSTLLFAQWALATWVVGEGAWWLGPDWLAFGIALLALLGLIVAAIFYRIEVATGENYAQGPPTFVEYLALGGLTAFGLVWLVYQAIVGGEILDQMAITTFACLCGLVHLFLRRSRNKAAQAIPTEPILLAAIVAGGLVLFFADAPLADEAPRVAGEVRGEWPMLLLNERRTGAAEGQKPIVRPKILWAFDPALPRGKVSFHSSPTVVDGQLFIGALYELGGKSTGILFCADASTGANAGSKRWTFSRNSQWMPIFATPIVAGGKVLFGEGYHDNRDCSLGCIDPRSPAEPLWLFKTTSHVESTPTVKAGRIYFGAGDDGLYCLDMPDEKALTAKTPDKPIVPKVRWHRELFHIDSSPLLAEGKVIVGTVVGDVHFATLVLAVDAETGKNAWEYRTQYAVPGSPSYSDGRIYVGIGNGKMTDDAEKPAGSVLCLTAAKGDFVWEFKTANSVLESPVVAGERIVFTCRDGQVYCVNAADGKLVWKHPLGDPIAAAPILSGDRIYAVTVGGHVFCLKLSDGEEVWKLDVPSPDNDTIANPCLVGGRLYVASGGKVYCLGEAGP